MHHQKPPKVSHWNPIIFIPRNAIAHYFPRRSHGGTGDQLLQIMWAVSLLSGTNEVNIAHNNLGRIRPSRNSSGGLYPKPTTSNSILNLYCSSQKTRFAYQVSNSALLDQTPEALTIKLPQAQTIKLMNHPCT
ncbi:hypothetical protein CDAR_97881 [Caerostris darwini]|uniref:Uncharacterized protein n=1 Tax=Caerostris darwini TaxID=1538125 RepID=A0AAV4MHR0_9ARAC|nr:hypothetical protein CDAR_97881 [Caerostris darwini]